MSLVAIVSPLFDGILLSLRPWSKEIHVYPSLVPGKTDLKYNQTQDTKVMYYTETSCEVKIFERNPRVLNQHKLGSDPTSATFVCCMEDFAT